MVYLIRLEKKRNASLYTHYSQNIENKQSNGHEMLHEVGVAPLAARSVALLVVCVTPANFYMLSHGAVMPGVLDGPLPMTWHAGRFVAQASVVSACCSRSRARQAAGADGAATPAIERTRREKGAGGSAADGVAHVPLRCMT